MLRVGLTGGLGSGKSTVAAYLRELGAVVIEADALGRELMQPDQPVYEAIVGAFGPEVVLPNGNLDRAKLAEMAFRGGRLNELNSLVHPPVIAAQQRWMDQVFARNPAAVAVVESALIFEVERDARARGVEEGILADWRQRIDRIVLVTASDDLKIARFVDRLDPSSGNRWPRPPGPPDPRCAKGPPRRLYSGQYWRSGRPPHPGRGAVAAPQDRKQLFPVR